MNISTSGSRDVKLTSNAAMCVFKHVRRKASTIAGLETDWAQTEPNLFLVDDFALDLALTLQLDLAMSTAATASLELKVFKQPNRESDVEHEAPEYLHGEDFGPSFEDGKIVWREDTSNHSFSDEELADHALGLFKAERKRTSIHRKPNLTR